MIPLTIQNNTYTSIAAAWRECSPETLKLITVRWRLKNGWTTWDAVMTPPVLPEDRRNFKQFRCVIDEVTD